jgi:hypothetical protein
VSTVTSSAVRDWQTAGPFEWPTRITPKWIMARIPTATAEWFLALCEQLLDRAWGGGNNEDIEWFLVRCLPQREQRRVEAVQHGYVLRPG